MGVLFARGQEVLARFIERFLYALDADGDRCGQGVMGTAEQFHHGHTKVLREEIVQGHVKRSPCRGCRAHLLAQRSAQTRQRAHIYPKYGLDPAWVREAVMEAFDASRIQEMRKESTNLWRIVIKTLRKGGVITERTRDRYSMFLDMDSVDAEPDGLAAQDVVDEGLADLREINAGKRHRFLTTEQFQEKMAAQKIQARIASSDSAHNDRRLG